MKWFAITLSMLLLLPLAGSHAAMADEVRSKKPDSSVVTNDPQQGNGLFRVFGYGMYMATAADAASTEWGLSRPEIFELNPLMANRGVRISAHALAPVAMWWTTERLRKKGHGRSALLLRIGMTTGYGYLALRNIRMATRH